MSKARVINTQGLLDVEVDIIKESPSVIMVDLFGEKKNFWKESGLQFGYSKILRSGNEPNRIIFKQDTKEFCWNEWYADKDIYGNES